MENENPKENITEDVKEFSEEEKISELPAKRDYLIPVSILISSIILASAWIYTAELKTSAQKVIVSGQGQVSELEGKVLPIKGVELPVVWADLGAKLVSA